MVGQTVDGRGSSRMKRLLNTLYVATEGARLRKDGETIAVEIDGRVAKRTPAHLLGPDRDVRRDVSIARCDAFRDAIGDLDGVVGL